MVLALLLMVFIFHSLIILLEKILLLVTSTVEKLLTTKPYLRPLVASVVVGFKAVVLLLLNHNLLFVLFVFGPCFVMQFLMSFPALQLSRLGRESCRFTLIVFLLACGC